MNRKQKLGSNGLVCPYCGYEHYGGDQRTSEYPEQYECQDCGRTFEGWLEITYDYWSQTIEDKS